uniref:Uncharacterized protein n=1 Tax=Oryza sativa subsp. japonica TaxID=39947 RepID=Q5Z9S2_ORYSJ|nr:hypothetical protein [Oryza sativa Japonica Group]
MCQIRREKRQKWSVSLLTPFCNSRLSRSNPDFSDHLPLARPHLHRRHPQLAKESSLAPFCFFFSANRGERHTRFGQSSAALPRAWPPLAASVRVVPRLPPSPRAWPPLAVVALCPLAAAAPRQPLSPLTCRRRPVPAAFLLRRLPLARFSSLPPRFSCAASREFE